MDDTRMFIRKPKENRPFEDLQTDWRILKQIKIPNRRIRIWFIGLRI